MSRPKLAMQIKISSVYLAPDQASGFCKGAVDAEHEFPLHPLLASA